MGNKFKPNQNYTRLHNEGYQLRIRLLEIYHHFENEEMTVKPRKQPFKITIFLRYKPAEFEKQSIKPLSLFLQSSCVHCLID